VDRDFSGGLEEGLQLTRPHALGCRHHQISPIKWGEDWRRESTVGLPGPAALDLYTRQRRSVRGLRHVDVLESAVSG
jgi:hypothetical protein